MKKYLLSLCIVITAISAVAFTYIEGASKANRLTYYYRFDGYANIQLQFEDINYWTQVSSPGASGCPYYDKIPCLVQIDDAPTKQDLIDEIVSDPNPVNFVFGITIQWKDRI